VEVVKWTLPGTQLNCDSFFHSVRTFDYPNYGLFDSLSYRISLKRKSAKYTLTPGVHKPFTYIKQFLTRLSISLTQYFPISLFYFSITVESLTVSPSTLANVLRPLII